MGETSTEDQGVIEDGGSMELVRVPAWEAKYKLNENPEELAHLVCCRDLEWRRAMCGYVEEDPRLMYEATIICTMCMEVVRSLGVIPGSGVCPIDHRPCPNDEEIDRMIAERTSRS